MKSKKTQQFVAPPDQSPETTETTEGGYHPQPGGSYVIELPPEAEAVAPAPVLADEPLPTATPTKSE